VSIEPKIKYEGFGGGAPCWWGAWGPGPLGPLKSGPVSNCYTSASDEHKKLKISWQLKV